MKFIITKLPENLSILPENKRTHPCPHRQLTQQEGPFWQPSSSSCPAHLPSSWVFSIFSSIQLTPPPSLFDIYHHSCTPFSCSLFWVLHPTAKVYSFHNPQARLRGHLAGQVLYSSPAGVPALSSPLFAPYLWPPCLFPAPGDYWPSCTPFSGLLEVSIHGLRKQHGWEPYSAVSVKWCFLKIPEFQWVDIKELLWYGLFSFLIKVSGFDTKLFKS